MKFALHIKSSPYHRQACRTALRFAQSLISKEYTLSLVFFSSEAVVIANRLASAPQDEEDLQSQWRALSQSEGFTLGICSAAAVRLGVCSGRPHDVSVPKEGGRAEEASTAQHEEVMIDNLAPGYQLAGLGEWVEASVECDRVLMFG